MTELTAKPDTNGAPRSGPPRRRIRLVWKVLLLVGVLVVLDVLIGVTMCRGGKFLRWRLPPFAIELTEQQRKFVVRSRFALLRIDETLGWSFAPGRRTRRVEDGIESATNKDGLRGARRYERQAPSGVTRVAAFGDSFTFGNEVADDESWAAQIEAARDDFEVLNFGVGGYGPDQAYMRYLQDGVAFAPEVVLIGFMLENIGRTVSVYRPAYSLRSQIPVTKPRFRLVADGELELIPNPIVTGDALLEAVDDGTLLPILDETDYWVQRSPRAFHGSPIYWSSFVRIASGYVEHRDRRSMRRFYDDTGSEPFRLTVALLERFSREAVENGAERAIVLVFPDRQAVEAKMAGGEPYWQSLLDALAKRDVEVVDVTPTLADAAKRIGVDGVFRHVHYAPEGNAVVAERVLELLEPSSP